MSAVLEVYRRKEPDKWEKLPQGTWGDGGFYYDKAFRWLAERLPVEKVDIAYQDEFTDGAEVFRPKDFEIWRTAISEIEHKENNYLAMQRHRRLLDWVEGQPEIWLYVA